MIAMELTKDRTSNLTTLETLLKKQDKYLEYFESLYIPRTEQTDAGLFIDTSGTVVSVNGGEKVVFLLVNEKKQLINHGGYGFINIPKSGYLGRYHCPTGKSAEPTRVTCDYWVNINQIPLAEIIVDNGIAYRFEGMNVDDSMGDIFPAIILDFAVGKKDKFFRDFFTD